MVQDRGAFGLQHVFIVGATTATSGSVQVPIAQDQVGLQQLQKQSLTRAEFGTDEWHSFLSAGRGVRTNVASRLETPSYPVTSESSSAEPPFQVQQFLRRLHTLLRVTGTVILQRAW